MDIYLLASERSEQDTLRSNAIKISVYLFIYLYGIYVLFFHPRYQLGLGKAFLVILGAGKLCITVTIANGHFSGMRLLCRFQFLVTGAFY